MDKLLYIVVGIAIPVALLLCVILALELRRLMGVINLYHVPQRDMQFVGSLLRFYLPGGKWRILQRPCLLTDNRVAPTRADLVIIGGKGVMVLTVDDRKGHFSTPATGSWTLWQDGKGQRIPNRFNEGWQYVDVIQRIMAENGISCPVYNHIVLSDDYAKFDDLHSENVFTGAQLVPYARGFCKGKELSKEDQQKLREAIAAHHRSCREKIAKAKQIKAAEQADATEKIEIPMNLLESLLGNAQAPANEQNENTEIK